MKRFISVLLAVLFVFGNAFAASVVVNISDDTGELAVAGEYLDISDADEDGVLTVFDALYSAHEAFYEGGAQAGFTAIDEGYGLSIGKLWGVENGGSYGYYVNNASAFSLLDPLQDGDVVSAFVYTDLETWSDTFCYFDDNAVKSSGTFQLKLLASGYDAAWNPVSIPVENAVITIDGEDSSFVTDVQGNVEITIETSGSHIISARSDSMRLVPPVCKAEIG